MHSAQCWITLLYMHCKDCTSNQHNSIICQSSSQTPSQQPTQTGIMGVNVMQSCTCDVPNQAESCWMHPSGSSNMTPSDLTPLDLSTQPATSHVCQHHTKQLAPHILLLSQSSLRLFVFNLTCMDAWLPARKEVPRVAER